MSANYSRQSYEDCYELMDSALANGNGIRVGFDDAGEAKHFRMRMNYARTLDQKYNADRYDIKHPKHGKSDYDILSVRYRRTDDRYWVYVEKRKAPAVIEEIKPGEGADTIGPRRAVQRRF